MTPRDVLLLFVWLAGLAVVWTLWTRVQAEERQAEARWLIHLAAVDTLLADIVEEAECEARYRVAAANPRSIASLQYDGLLALDAWYEELVARECRLTVEEPSP